MQRKDCGPEGPHPHPLEGPSVLPPWLEDSVSCPCQGSICPLVSQGPQSGPAPQRRPHSLVAQVPSAAWSCFQVHRLPCFLWVWVPGMPSAHSRRGEDSADDSWPWHAGTPPALPLMVWEAPRLPCKSPTSRARGWSAAMSPVAVAYKSDVGVLGGPAQLHLFLGVSCRECGRVQGGTSPLSRISGCGWQWSQVLGPAGPMGRRWGSLPLWCTCLTLLTLPSHHSEE